jgi:hypothetical protein
MAAATARYGPPRDYNESDESSHHRDSIPVGCRRGLQWDGSIIVLSTRSIRRQRPHSYTKAGRRRPHALGRVDFMVRGCSHQLETSRRKRSRLLPKRLVQSRCWMTDAAVESLWFAGYVRRTLRCTFLGRCRRIGRWASSEFRCG